MIIDEERVRDKFEASGLNKRVEDGRVANGLNRMVEK
jgi:hypothetical protein